MGTTLLQSRNPFVRVYRVFVLGLHVEDSARAIDVESTLVVLVLVNLGALYWSYFIIVVADAFHVLHVNHLFGLFHILRGIAFVEVKLVILEDKIPLLPIGHTHICRSSLFEEPSLIEVLVANNLRARLFQSLLLSESIGRDDFCLSGGVAGSEHLGVLTKIF